MYVNHDLVVLCGVVIMSTHPRPPTPIPQHPHIHPHTYTNKRTPSNRDRPEFGQLYFLQAEEGDIVLMASDGLFDNLYDQVSKLIGQRVCVRGLGGLGCSPFLFLLVASDGLSDNLYDQVWKLVITLVHGFSSMLCRFWCPPSPTTLPLTTRTHTQHLTPKTHETQQNRRSSRWWSRLSPCPASPRR